MHCQPLKNFSKECCECWGSLRVQKSIKKSHRGTIDSPRTINESRTQEAPELQRARGEAACYTCSLLKSFPWPLLVCQLKLCPPALGPHLWHGILQTGGTKGQPYLPGKVWAVGRPSHAFSGREYRGGLELSSGLFFLVHLLARGRKYIVFEV